MKVRTNVKAGDAKTTTAKSTPTPTESISLPFTKVEFHYS